MGEGYFLDIIFLAMVAGFIFFRLRNVLGRRTGNEQSPPDQQDRERTGDQSDDQGASNQSAGDDNVVALPDRGHLNQVENNDVTPEAEAALWADDSPIGAGLTKIKLADHRFEPSAFTDGARAAYEMIVDAFANGDHDALRPLLNDQVFENFVGAIDDREDKGHTLETKIVAINGTEIIEIGRASCRERV